MKRLNICFHVAIMQLNIPYVIYAAYSNTIKLVCWHNFLETAKTNLTHAEQFSDKI